MGKMISLYHIKKVGLSEWRRRGGGPDGKPDWGILMDSADYDASDSAFQKGWVEVDLPVPEAVIVQGTAVMEGDR